MNTTNKGPAWTDARITAARNRMQAAMDWIKHRWGWMERPVSGSVLVPVRVPGIHGVRTDRRC